MKNPQKFWIKPSTIVIAIFLSSLAFGQDLNKFVTNRANGPIPQEFVKLSQDKVKVDYASNSDQNLDKDFFLSSRYFIDQLLLGGRVLFNEPLSIYLNKVAEYTLRSEKKLYDELRFYVLKSNNVNAFSTDQGIIVFTTGLLAQLENEAQLAYIIAHEVSHYTAHHVRSSYVETQNIKRGNDKYRQLDYESRVNELSVYSKSLEFEADNMGIDIFLKTEYDINEVFTSFEMLLYSYLPFDEVRFDPTFFNTSKLEIPSIYFADTLKPVSLLDDYDDKKSTHPNIKRRIDSALDKIGTQSSRGKLKYKISESEFNKIQMLARFEVVNIGLMEREYGKVIYNLFLLKREIADNRFLDLALVKALYGMAKYKNGNRYKEVVEKPKDVEGESFPLHLFLYDIGKEEINTIALRHCYDMAQKYPNDPIFREYLEDLKIEIALKSKIDYSKYSNKPFTEFSDSIAIEVQSFDIQDSINKVDQSDLSKYEKIRLKRKLNELLALGGVEEKKDLQFYYYSLFDLVQNGLIKEMDEIVREDQAEKESTTKVSAKTNSRVSKVVVIDPIYRDYNLKNKQNLEKSENKKITLASAYTKKYRNLDLEVDIIDSKNMDQNTVTSYNDIGVVFPWVTEVFEHDNIQMISSSHDQMNELTRRYGTDQFLLSGIYAFKERNEATINHVLLGFTIYGLPFVLADLLIIHNSFELVSFSLDATKDQIIFKQALGASMKANNQVIDFYIYDLLNQIKNGGN